jgi:LysR family transcriptional regulator of abg operon
VVLARHGHPLANARSLGDLAGALWVSTSITERADAEIGDLFRQHRLPAPRMGARTQGGALGLVTLLAHTDMLAIVPRQWTEFPPTKGNLRMLELKETIAAPPITLIRRAALPLTPAAEYLCDLLRRAGAQHAKKGGSA